MNFEALYREELEERERLRAAAHITIGILALLGGLLAAMGQSLWFDATGLCLAFLALTAAALGFFVRALYFVVRCYHGHKYKGMPTALACRNHRDALRKWHVQYGKGQADADAEFEAWLEDAHATAADINGHVNERRSGCLFTANGATVYCLVCALAAAVPYSIHRVMLPPLIQKVEVVGVPATTPHEVTMADDKPNPPPPPPPKPTPPPLRDLREGNIPKKPR
jgi:hypothetical protein